AGVHGDAVAVNLGGAQVGGVGQGVARGVQLRHEGRLPAHHGQGGLVGPESGGEVMRLGRANQIGVAAGIHGDAVGPVAAGAAEEVRVEDGVAGRAELADKGVLRAAGAKVNAVGRREVDRGGHAGDV